MPTDRLFAYLTLTRILESQGDFAGAFLALRNAKELRSSQPVLMTLARSTDIYEIRLLLVTHDIAAAARLMDGLRPGTIPMVNIREQELIALARVRLAQGRNSEAAAILSPLSKNAEAGGRGSTLLESLALQAQALDAQGNREAAMEILIKALTFAEPEGFVRIFVEEGEAMYSLLLAAADQLASTTDPGAIPLKAYITKLLNVFLGDSPTGLGPHPQNKLADLVELLTSRELEVLQLIANGDSNRTIAEKLVITVSAVKKHTSNIFGKLDVNSRTQALARAHQLGLLPADG
jgi:LuxR family transcriptional regulator, maltose regulon positive regulatory protein